MTENSASATPPLVTHVPNKRRYEISSDSELAGFVEYADRENQRVFYHTEIDSRFSGRGLASELVNFALSDTRAAGMRVAPVCPYVDKYVRRHTEFDDVVDPVTTEAIATAKAAQRR